MKISYVFYLCNSLGILANLILANQFLSSVNNLFWGNKIPYHNQRENNLNNENSCRFYVIEQKMAKLFDKEHHRASENRNNFLTGHREREKCLESIRKFEADEKIKEMKRIEQFLKSKKEAIFNAHLASRVKSSILKDFFALRF
jgi:hypothetical protein